MIPLSPKFGNNFDGVLPLIATASKGQIEGAHMRVLGGRSFQFFGGFDARGKVSRCAH